MRRFLTSKPVKLFGATTAVAVGGAAVFGARFGWGGGGKNQAKLTAPEFNSVQDQAQLQASLAKLPLLEANDEIVTMYAMLGCPFCARVRSILDYYGVPYEEVIVDPFSGGGLEESPLKTVPQVQFRVKSADGKKGTKKERAAPVEPKKDADGKPVKPTCAAEVPLLQDGPMVVDSDCIIRALSVPLGFSEELETSSVEEEREALTTHFQRYVYISTHATWARSTEAMKGETSATYQIFPLNWIAGGLMYLIATKKVLKRAMANTTLTFRPDATPAMKSDKMLLDYLQTNVTERATEKGLKAPLTLIDIEMHGVLSQVHELPHIKALLEEAKVVPWLERVDKAVTSHAGMAALQKGAKKKK